MVAGGTQSRWALILAGGDGRRLRPLTRQIAGDDRPKQFCPVLGGETLLEQTRRRVAALAPSERVLVVVVRAHERFYAPLLADVPSRCVVIQPENRGTAPAILYGLLRLTARSEEHTSELQSLTNLVCRLLLEKKNNRIKPV